MPRPRLFNIPPGAPFLRTFVDALLGGRILEGFPNGDPLALAATTIYAPTRRAARALADAFVERSKGASLLPRIIPLGEAEEIASDLSFEAAADAEAPEIDEPTPSAIDEIERRLALANLILAWGRAVRNAIVWVDEAGPRADPGEAFLVAATPAQALSLARELCALIDEFIIEDASWSALDSMVPDAFDRYWRITLDFLKVAREHWPVLLQARGRVDPAARRAALLERASERLLAGAAEEPTIAIGSTGTNKATARLLAAIARAPRGAVVLPGLDASLDAATWNALADPSVDPSVNGHPQAALRRLLGALGADRAEVRPLAAPPRAAALRAQFLTQAFLPAAATDRWSGFDRSILASALHDVALIEAADEREEALALAARLREAIENPNLTAAVITPSRAIAKRVRAELARWSVEVEDSAGEPLANTPAGVFARLAPTAALERELGLQQLALLAHPKALLGFDRARVVDLAGIAEVALARGASPPMGGLKERIQAARAAAEGPHAHPALAGVHESDWRDLEILLDRLSEALKPLRALAEGASLAQWVAAHRRSMAAIAPNSPDGEDERVLEAFFERLAEAARDDQMAFDAQDYLDAFERLAFEAAVRGAPERKSRIAVLGLLEARLMSFDLVLLAGLDEGVWPPSVDAGPFLNRPMRAEVGLSPPERRIGQTAHDFIQALGAPAAALSRAKKRGGTPTTPSRFLQRMEALAGEAIWSEARARGDRWVRLAEALETAPPCAPIGAPKPRPALALRPRSLSVTRIETLRRDPYAIYAEFILRIRPLAPIGPCDFARLAGEGLHAALAQFILAYPQGPLPSDAAAILRRLAATCLGAQIEDVEWRVFHWPRLVKALDAFVAFESARRDAIQRVFIEQRGGADVALADGSAFRLTAIADRIDLMNDGSYTVVDYKSGRAPSIREIACGFSPQLTLEAAMIARGAFACAPSPAAVADGFYVSFAGGEIKTFATVREKGSTDALPDLAERHFNGALALLSQFRNETTAYVSRPYPQFASRFSDYDHLARVKEWSSPSEGEDPA